MNAVMSPTRVLSLLGLFSLVLGSLVVMPQVAVSSDAPATNKNLGMVEIDCSGGDLAPSDIKFNDVTVGYTGGQGDHFYLMSVSGDCTISDTSSIVSGDSADLVLGLPQKLTITAEGSFTVTDSVGRTITITTNVQPVFANQIASPNPGRISFTCNTASEGPVDYMDQTRIVYVSSFPATYELYNSSSSASCQSLSGNPVTSFDGADPLPGTLSARNPVNVTVEAAGTVAIVGADVFGFAPPPFYIAFVQSPTAGDVELGIDQSVNAFVDYEDVYVVNGQAVDARVTFIAEDGLQDDVIDAIDANENPSNLNWGIASSINVEGSSDQVTNSGTGTLRVDFKDGDGNAVNLAGLVVTIRDLDSGQFVGATNVQTYQLSSSPATHLTVESFTSGTLLVSSDEDDSSSDDEEDHWLVMRFGNTSSIQFTLGAVNGRGASFLIVFNSTEFTGASAVNNEPSERNRSTNPDDVSPAIALDLQATVGSPTAQASAFIEGQGLQVGSSYTLQLGPSGRVLYSGIVGDSGRFDHTVGLVTELAPGQYFVELRASGKDGSLLVLTQAFTVGAGGIITFVGQSAPGSVGGSGLANTGVDASMMMLGGLSLLLLLAGMASVAASRLRSRVSA